MSTSSTLVNLVTDSLRFIAKFYQLIKRSALHTYHSALPFVPTDTMLYRQYNKQMSFSMAQGGPKEWNAVVANRNPNGSQAVGHLVFSSDSTMLACHTSHQWSEGQPKDSMEIQDATTGIPIEGTQPIEGNRLAIANDFSVVASSNDGRTITLCNIKGTTSMDAHVINAPTTILDLALSPDGSRLFAWLEYGSIMIWDRKGRVIQNLDVWARKAQFAFSSSNNKVAIDPGDASFIRLLDIMSGKTLAYLDCSLQSTKCFEEREIKSQLLFSCDGSRLACLVANTNSQRRWEEGSSILRLWDSKGNRISTIKNVGIMMAISTDGSLLVTGVGQRLKLWSGNDGDPIPVTKAPNLNIAISSLAFSGNDILAIASKCDDIVLLYDVKSHTLISRLQIRSPTALAFSPNHTRLAAGNGNGAVHIWDVPSIKASNSSPQEKLSPLLALAFSLDCLHLASGHKDGTVRVWDTRKPTQPVVSPLKHHSAPVTKLTSSTDGTRFASWSKDGIVTLWSNKDGILTGTHKWSGHGELAAMALSGSELAMAKSKKITLLELEIRTVTTLNQMGAILLELSDHHYYLAVTTRVASGQHTHRYGLTLWHTGKGVRIASFDFENDEIRRMALSPDDSVLAVQCQSGFRLFNIRDGNNLTVVSRSHDISRLGLCPCWRGIPIWTEGRDRVVGLFPQQESTVTVLTRPSDLDIEVVAQGSSMIAYGCKNGRILLVRPNT